jgi:hypothetical protein
MQYLDLTIPAILLGLTIFAAAIVELTLWLTKLTPEDIYVELSISPRELREITRKAVDMRASTLVMPPVLVKDNTRRAVQLAFVDQRLRLEETLASSSDEDNDYDDFNRV